ncbi:MAG: type 4a pilus biogenesis protein PilO, partial [Gammaproteobacteria bacterium]|nr:type 4a pilus biogenesis protein PilO [Gammaproteobacteria bacterium]
MLRQLPNKTEVADLLVDVSQTGLASGLEFELFNPESEVPREFYAELPIKIRVVGDYHEFGDFVSGVATLPRIVTLHNVNIKRRGSKEGGGLVMNLTAKTYRYLEDSERSGGSSKKKKGKKGKKGKKSGGKA